MHRHRRETCVVDLSPVFSILRIAKDVIVQGVIWIVKIALEIPVASKLGNPGQVHSQAGEPQADHKSCCIIV